MIIIPPIPPAEMRIGSLGEQGRERERENDERVKNSRRDTDGFFMQRMPSDLVKSIELV